jgi:hypothetical protein
MSDRVQEARCIAPPTAPHPQRIPQVVIGTMGRLAMPFQISQVTNHLAAGDWPGIKSHVFPAHEHWRVRPIYGA